MPTIGFLHTAVAHVATFERLVSAAGATATTSALVDESLLARARAHGVTPDLESAVAARLRDLVARGCDRIVCTCSTLGGVAEDVARRADDLAGIAVVRVDRPMAERAVAVAAGAGGAVLVVAALADTVGPTTALVEEIAGASGCAVTVEVLVVEGAWARWEAGDVDGYLATVADAVRGASGVAAVVLAQASMAPVAGLVDVGVPVLASPALAVAAVLGEPGS